MVENICWIQTTSVKPFWKKQWLVFVCTVPACWEPTLDSLGALGRVNNNTDKDQVKERVILANLKWWASQMLLNFLVPGAKLYLFF